MSTPFYAIAVLAGVMGTTIEASGPYPTLSACTRAVAQAVQPRGVQGVGCVTEAALMQMRSLIR